jgi:hypothetical protein
MVGKAQCLCLQVEFVSLSLFCCKTQIAFRNTEQKLRQIPKDQFAMKTRSSVRSDKSNSGNNDGSDQVKKNKTKETKTKSQGNMSGRRNTTEHRAQDNETFRSKGTYSIERAIRIQTATQMNSMMSKTYN